MKKNRHFLHVSNFYFSPREIYLAYLIDNGFAQFSSCKFRAKFVSGQVERSGVKKRMQLRCNEGSAEGRMKGEREMQF